MSSIYKYSGKLVNNDIYVDDGLGMAWKLNQVFPQNFGNDPDKLNKGVDAMNESIGVATRFCCIGVVGANWNKLYEMSDAGKKLCQAIISKSFLALYLTEKVTDLSTIKMPEGWDMIGFIIEPDKTVYTAWNGDNLNQYCVPCPVPQATTTPTEPTPTTGTTIVSSTAQLKAMCLQSASIIAVHNSQIDNAILQPEPIEQLADTLLNGYVLKP
jgi:hypothetical protein